MKAGLCFPVPMSRSHRPTPDQAKRCDRNQRYTIASLPVGPYRLEVALRGFRSYLQTGIVLQVSSNPVINVTLAVGQFAETVTVQANAASVDTRNMGVGAVMDNRRILDLPLNGRNPADLLQFLPAAVPQPLLNATSRSMQGGQAYSWLAGALSVSRTSSMEPRTTIRMTT